MSNLSIEEFTNAVAAVATAPCGLHEPTISGTEWDNVKACLDTGWVSTAGAFVNRFEEQLAAATNSRHVIATASGTAALHVSLICAGVQRDDEVIVPALTFIATANAVAYIGAVPHFVDVSDRTLGLDVERLDRHLTAMCRKTQSGVENTNTGRTVKAIVVMHTYGHPCDLDGMRDLANRWDLALIEDAAESLGSYYKGRHTGNDGVVSAFSFNGNKIVTAGAGGAIVTNDDRIAAHARHLSTTAKQPHPYEFVHDEIGFNYRLPNLNAALACAQLDALNDLLAKKRLIAEAYQAAFEGVVGASVFMEPDGCKSNYWLNVVLLDEELADMRDPILTALNSAGLGSRPAWMPMHQLTMFDSCPRMDLAMTESIYARLICLPSSAHI